MLGLPLLPCGCTLIPSLDVVNQASQTTLSLPLNVALIGVQIATQGMDFLAPQSCIGLTLARTAVGDRYVLEMITTAVHGCRSGHFDALVTAPVHKGVINDAGLPFTGHTEMLAELTGTPQVVMMLVGGGLRVALATTHLPLSAVPGAITIAALTRTLQILDAALRRDFGIAQPRILVSGLNPHAGEGGHLGREEIDVITPVIDALRATGIDARGPLPADTLFNPDRLQGCDAALAMFHDQGLPVLKYASFGAGVNVTLGLPIIRTSVDHGTALDLAGTGRALDGSLREAVALAIDLARNRSA